MVGFQGVGIGLRTCHYSHVLSARPRVPWFEVISENYMGVRTGRSVPKPAGRPLEILERVRRDYTVALHGVSLNIGSCDPLDLGYLRQLKSLIERVQPTVVSDHLCWTGRGGQNLHDLLPLPYTEEALNHVVGRLRRVQEVLGRRLLIENVSSYVAYRHSRLSEWDFLSELCRRADCGLLLDVNNIYVSAVNHGFEPRAFIDGVPSDRVGQMHLAGYSQNDGFLIDTHDHPVSDPVWALYARAVRRFGPVPTLIEWDEKIPSFERLEQEAARAARIQRAPSEALEPAVA